MDENTNAIVDTGDLGITDWNDLTDDGDSGETEGQESADQLTPDESTETTSEAPKAPETKETKAEVNTPAEETKAPDAQPETLNSFELKHLGEVKKVNKDEMIVLAQKGLDYDRLKGNQDERLTFIKELAEASGFKNEKEFIEQTRKNIVESAINALAEEKNCDYEVAKELYETRQSKKAEANRIAAEAQAKADADNAAAEAQRRTDREVEAFMKRYPTVDPKTIPQAVKDSVNNDGLSLLNAYEAWRLAEDRAKFEADKQNYENEKKSVGSKKTSGEQLASDPWLTDLESRFR